MVVPPPMATTATGGGNGGTSHASACWLASSGEALTPARHFTVLKRAGLLAGGDLRALAPGPTGVVLEPDGTAHPDDGTLTHPAKAADQPRPRTHGRQGR